MPFAIRLLSPRVALAVAALALLPVAAAASVPSPANSTLPACLATTPGGNILTVIIVRDLANNPINNSLVVIDYSQCAGFVPCPQTGSPSDPYIVDLPTSTLRMFTNASGQAVFPVRAGGGCSSSGIAIYADGVQLRTMHAASADQNGDLSVDGADVAAVNAKVATTDLSGDMDCNNVVNAADVAIVSGYVGVNCVHPTEAARPTWGRIKTIYR